MTTFNPPIQPSISGLSKSVNARALVATFGDGYTQRGSDGLNAIGRTYSLTWNALSVANADTIESFFEARAGYEAFEWTAPRDSVAKKWIVQEWTRSNIDPTLDSISATFIQVFDL